MSATCDTIYKPQASAKDIYDKLYSEYITLHDYFGKGGNDIMKHLIEIRKAAKNNK